MIARSSSIDADRRPTLPKWTALAAAKSGGGTPRVETSGRLDIKHRQRLAAFISAPLFAFSHAVLRAGCTGDAGASARAPEMRRTQTCGYPVSESDLLGCVCVALGRCEEAGVESPAGPFALIAPPNSAKQGPDLYESKDPDLILSMMSTNDELNRVGRGAFIWGVSPERDSTVGTFRGPSERSLAAPQSLPVSNHVQIAGMIVRGLPHHACCILRASRSNHDPRLRQVRPSSGLRMKQPCEGNRQ